MPVKDVFSSNRLLSQFSPFNGQIRRCPRTRRFELIVKGWGDEFVHEGAWTFEREIKYIVRDLPLTAHYLHKIKNHPRVPSVQRCLSGYIKGIEKRSLDSYLGTMDWNKKVMRQVAQAVLQSDVQVTFFNKQFPLTEFSISYKFTPKSVLFPLFNTFVEKDA